MMRVRFSTFFSIQALLFCAMGAIVPQQVWAQDRIPKIDALNQEKPIELPMPNDYFSGFDTNNVYLEDTLRLQYQISLLEKMIQRQSSISRLEKNYQELGLPFRQPLPPRGICEQIPANIPCYRAYPELYDVVLPVVGQLDTLIEEPLSVDMILDESELREEPSAPAPDSHKKAEPVSYVADRYNWTEVLCGGGVCSAVVVKDNNPMLRRTVQEGDLLEGGNITVGKITAKGVTVLEEGKTVSLSPARAPGQGGPVSPVMTTAPVPSATAVQNSAGVGNAPPITQTPVEATSVQSPEKTKLEDYEKALEENQDIVDPGPPVLGPTGLF
jgi:hypothetical protein